MGFFKNATLGLLVAIGAILIGFQFQKRVDIPKHLTGHNAVFMYELFDEKISDELMQMTKEMGALELGFPTNSNDLMFYKAKHEHIGEAVPVNSEGKCDHPFLVPNGAKELCILPGRIDVGRHYIMHGGVVGLKETYESLISRVQSFGRYYFDPENYPTFQRLFEQESFMEAARQTCPSDKQVLDCFQSNLIMQVPGQTVATHVDGVYFWGASRFEFPQWLLAVMKFSGLFEKEYIDQVQLVGYVHKWNDTKFERDGKFVYWNTEDGETFSVPPYPRAGVSVDGAKVVHAASVYRPSEFVPYLDRNKLNKLRYVPERDEWNLFSDNDITRTYTTDDLRITVVYRARCFATEEEKERFHHQKEEDQMTLDGILSTLTSDLIKRGRTTQEKLQKLERIDLALFLMDEYIKYPKPPTALVPYNYCALGRLIPAVNPILKFICPTNV